MECFYSSVVTSSLLIVVIILIRAAFSKKINMRLQYALWLFVAIKLLIFPVPWLESRLSVRQLFSGFAEGWQEVWDMDHGSADQTSKDGAGTRREGLSKESAMQSQQVQSAGSIDSQQASGQVAGSIDSQQTSGRVAGSVSGQQSVCSTDSQQSFGQLAEGYLSLLNSQLQGSSLAGLSSAGLLCVGIAAAGCAGMFLYFLIGNFRFAGYLRRRRMRDEQSGFPLPVYLVEGLPSPCLYGRAVYLTPQLADDEQRRLHVMTHEYCHYRQGDLVWSVLRCLCVICYWWDPLVWLAAYLSKQDSELACDEAALKLLGDEERLLYGRTLLSLITAKERPKDYLIATTMTGGGRSMKQRIQRIANKRKTLLPIGILVAVLSVICFISVSTAMPNAEKEDLQKAKAQSDMTEQAGRHTTAAEEEEAAQSAAATKEKEAAQSAANTEKAAQSAADAKAEKAAQSAADAKAEKAAQSAADTKAEKGAQSAADAKAEKTVSTASAEGTEKAAQSAADAKAEKTVSAASAEGAGKAAKGISDLDEAVSCALLSYSEDTLPPTECAAEGHILLGSEQGEDGLTTAYILGMDGWYQFQNGSFVKECGSGVIPRVLVFSQDSSQGYVLKDYRFPTDGDGYIESIQEMFPSRLWDRCTIIREKDEKELIRQEQGYARRYLKKIGRKADIGDYSEVDHPLLCDAGVSVEVSNSLYESDKRFLADYPDWIGDLERIEDGVRYRYALDLDKAAREIVYQKSVWQTGDIVEDIRLDMDTGKVKYRETFPKE